MALIGDSKYFIGLIFLSACGYLSSPVSSDTYHYIFLLANPDNLLYLNELTDEAIDVLEKHFPDLIINEKLKKATLYGSVRKCVNVLGTIGYRIFNYPVKPNLPEWILEKRIPSDDLLDDDDDDDNDNDNNNDLNTENNIPKSETLVNKPK